MTSDRAHIKSRSKYQYFDAAVEANSTRSCRGQGHAKLVTDHSTHASITCIGVENACAITQTQTRFLAWRLRVETTCCCLCVNSYTGQSNSGTRTTRSTHVKPYLEPSNKLPCTDHQSCRARCKNGWVLVQNSSSPSSDPNAM